MKHQPQGNDLNFPWSPSLCFGGPISIIEIRYLVGLSTIQEWNVFLKFFVNRKDFTVKYINLADDSFTSYIVSFSR